MNNNKLYKLKEIPILAGVSRRTVKRARENRYLEEVIDGNHVYITKKSADAWIKKRLANNQFKKVIADLGWQFDDKGIFIITNSRRQYMCNFTDVNFLYSRITDAGRVRVVAIDKMEFELTAREFISQNNFNQKTLSESRFRLTMVKNQFQQFSDILLGLDNGKILENTTGIGRVHPKIFNLGNKMIVSGMVENPAEVIWLDKTGYHIELSDKINIVEDGFTATQIWDKFHELYGKKAVLVLGFAIATLFFNKLLDLNGFFPILYITGDSGRGKSCLADLILQLFGLDTTFGSVNVSSNATKVGIEIKSMILKNLPLAIHEHNNDHLDMIKYRYDGQGSVKYDQNSPDNINQRQVEGSTIITTVERPLDKQFNSRCVIIDLDDVPMNKPLYDKLRKETKKLSGFILEILEKVSLEDITDEAEKMADQVEYDGYMSRIKDNYCLFAGAFMAITEKMDKAVGFPSRKEVIKYIHSEITKAEDMLNPLVYFIRELERIRETSASRKFMIEDERCLYFNFNIVWQKISESYKNKFFPFLSSKNIKNLLKDSEYMARFGSEIEPKDKDQSNLPITNYPKTISGRSRKCYVLRKDKLPGYFS